MLEVTELFDDGWDGDGRSHTWLCTDGRSWFEWSGVGSPHCQTFKAAATDCPDTLAWVGRGILRGQHVQLFILSPGGEVCDV